MYRFFFTTAPTDPSAEPCNTHLFAIWEILTRRCLDSFRRQDKIDFQMIFA